MLDIIGAVRAFNHRVSSASAGWALRPHAARRPGGGGRRSDRLVAKAEKRHLHLAAGRANASGYVGHEARRARRHSAASSSPIPTNLPGYTVCELMPQLSQQIHQPVHCSRRQSPYSRS